MDRTSNSAQWADLPVDLLEKIEKQFHQGIDDTLRFRAICRSFRSSVPLPPKVLSPYTPLKIPYPIDPNPSICDHLLLTQSTVYAVEPFQEISIAPEIAKTWVIKLEETDSGKLLWRAPLCRYSSTNVLELLPKSLCLLDYRIRKLAKEYAFAYVGADGKVICIRPIDMKAIFLQNVVVSKCLDEIDDEFVLMAMHSKGNLSMWRYDDKKWTHIDIGHDGVYFKDIVYHNNNFFCLDTNSLVTSVDPKSLNITQVAPPPPRVDKHTLKYLVRSSKNLFLIGKHYHSNFPNIYTQWVHFDVLKLDEEKHDWIQHTNELKDEVLFVTKGFSFSILADELRGCKRNCIYFIDNLFKDEKCDAYESNCKIFDLAVDSSRQTLRYSGLRQLG